ncbi:transcriptional regulator, HxlR family [Singulisphaera sp. GP187]|uniref:winged helix-turn-helix transcriptional regulator n=1 Tax=Singulisphaera sp. GP187 TaxID=1882752 RepID=UPI000926897D|nr:helix-turn-helix domain-containing protein [Singulisphaera sp. GP187]SIN73916.1 transcriptional regulator, HxlR family [Singulisphaera sp. GP187]
MSRRSYGCGLEAVVDVIGGKWKPLILWHLVPGARRFGELRRQVTDISEKMLIQNLREMDADGIVARRDFHEVPPRVEYSLTELGLSLADVLKPLCEWGLTHMNAIETHKFQCATLGPERGQSA